MKEMSKKCPLPIPLLHVHLEIRTKILSLYNNFNHPDSKMMKDIYKESVELTSVYLLEGYGKTSLEINDTIPHTRIDMGYQGTQNAPVHRYLYESECCSVPSFQ